MVQTADFSNLQEPAHLRELDGPDVGGILVEREVGVSLVIVREVTGQDAAQVSFAEDENMIQTLSAKGFCHGLRGAVRTPQIPIPLTR